jgi:23S rRNA-/tRNA-specific pseudouridylate synthase
MSGSIALHAHALTFAHPTTGRPITVVSSQPSGWQSLFS